MSTGWDYYCIPCKESSCLDLNHGEGQLLRLMKDRAALEAFGSIEITELWYFHNNGSPLDLAALFFARHKGHEVVVRNEYGEISGRCGKSVTCNCGRPRYCPLPPGHSGECSPRDP